MIKLSKFMKANLTLTHCLLFLLDLIISIFILVKVPYTEIDWSTYMQQANQYLNGQRDYANISGDTGPLVYPAGHLYVFSILHKLTDGGLNVFAGQIIFFLDYFLTIIILWIIYSNEGKNQVTLFLLSSLIARRVHSIYLLRMFNDCIAMTGFYLSLLFLIKNKTLKSAIFYSIAVSIKMNVLLTSPAIFLFLLIRKGMIETLQFIGWSGLVQMTLGYPFLSKYPLSYLTRSFDLGRVFLYKWTVNWKFVPEKIFLSRQFHWPLLFGHFACIVIFATLRWSRILKQKAIPTSTALLTCVFECNLIGICFARSLHYQFYAWYFHSLPFLLYSVTKTNIDAVLGYF
ncbi:hypothetical protein ACOME3_004208 [Neoechinorhynchus agilis]